MYNIEQPAPSDLVQKGGIIIPAHPNKNGFANYMIFGYKTPIT